MEKKRENINIVRLPNDISLVNKNSKTDEARNSKPIVNPTNVEGYYPRLTLHGAINLIHEDLRELSIILESFLPHTEKIGIQLSQTNPLIKEIITGTEIFQRLRGISQVELMPFAFQQVPWFTRYTHSCLTYVFGEYVIKKIQPALRLNLVETEAAKVSFLIHDIGHGPFSHLTERAFKRSKGKGGKIPKEYDHEYWTKILLHELKEQLFDNLNNPYLRKKLTKEEHFNLDVFSCALELTSKEETSVLSELLSSQIDIDRLSNYLGDRIVVNAILEEDDIKQEKFVQYLSSVQEVVENIKRILNGLLVLDKDENNNKCKPFLAIHEDAVNPVIHFLLDRHIIRYYLLKHYKREAANNLLEKILLRSQHLVRNSDIGSLGKTDLLVQTWLNGTHTESEFIKMDDQLLFNQIKKWGNHTRDPILKDLTLRFTANNFFSAYSCEKDNIPKKPDKEIIDYIKNIIRTSLKKQFHIETDEPVLEDYYFTCDETTSKPYHSNKDEILIYTTEKKVKTLSSYIKHTKNELGELLLNTEFERYLFILPPEINL